LPTKPAKQQRVDAVTRILPIVHGVRYFPVFCIPICSNETRCGKLVRKMMAEANNPELLVFGCLLVIIG
jgi:hypothetical protein